jgi:hypothetical protein
MSLSTYRLSPSIAVSDMARAQQFYEGRREGRGAGWGRR